VREFLVCQKSKRALISLREKSSCWAVEMHHVGKTRRRKRRGRDSRNRHSGFLGSTHCKEEIRQEDVNNTNSDYDEGTFM